MSNERLLKKVIENQRNRSLASIYISIVLGYLELENWKEALFFYELGRASATYFEDKLALEELNDILIKKDTTSLSILFSQLNPTNQAQLTPVDSTKT